MDESQNDSHVVNEGPGKIYTLKRRARIEDKSIKRNIIETEGAQ